MAENALLITLASFAALAAAYVLYGRFLARRVFGLSDQRPTPAHTLQDGVDYIPTKVPVLFGHHFASIAGLGPILGPAVAVIWGWVPAVLWIVLGCIFLGAVHDLGALTVSLRYKGRSVGDVCRELIGPRARLLFLLIIFFLMSLAMGAFVNAISSLFVAFNPDAVIPSFGLMFVAMLVGLAVYKLRFGLGPATVVGLVLFAGLIWAGVQYPVPSYEWFTEPQTQALLDDARDLPAADEAVAFTAPYGSTQAVRYLEAAGEAAAAEDLRAAEKQAQRTWILVLLGYGFIASVLPVWLLLQPRDYINSFQLYFALGCLFLGLVVAGVQGLEINRVNAPLFRPEVPETVGDPASAGAVVVFPLLFVTIACGAVSGFHSLVSSGTTVRQLNREPDALPIGFGGMLVEGALAILVVMTCVAGIGAAAWSPGGAYASWKSAGGLAAPLSAVVGGGANFLGVLGIPLAYGKAFLAVTIVAFALTTLDSATRLLRFNVEELLRSVGLPRLANPYVGSLVAVSGIAAFGLMPAGRILWVLFGTTNQLLAGLTLLTVSLFLFKLGRPVWYTLVPMVLMLAVSLWAMALSLIGFVSDFRARLALPETPTSKLLEPALLAGVSVVVLFMTAWLLVEAWLSFRRGRGGLGLEDETDRVTEPAAEPVAS